MRTLKFTLNSRIDQDTNISISTEELFDNDEEAHDRGKDVMYVIRQFFEGVAEASAEMD